MPPPKTHKKLTAAQKETLTRWIAEGAEYQPHWSFIAPQAAAAARGQERRLGPQPDRPLHPRRAGKAGLTPAPEADRRTLARRAQPRPDRPAAGAGGRGGVRQRPVAGRLRKVCRSDCWRRRTGASTAAATGSTLARYADTHGIHFDNYREIWAYRDWVINAFNRNMPFDQFTIEQLAGDLLPNPTLDQHVATGFNRCNITTNEGGAIPEEYLVLYTRDRTETTVAGLARPDRRLRGLPRPQVRSAQPERVLLAVRVLQQHHAGRDGRQHQGHAADHARAAAGGSAALGRAGQGIAGGPASRPTARKAAARADFDKWLAGAKAEASGGVRSRPTACALHAPLERRRRQRDSP